MTTFPPNPSILVPIRYPLTAESTRTIERAGQLAEELEAAELLFLHVNLLQHSRSSTQQEIHRAITPLIPNQQVSVSVRPSFLVEEAILDEVQSCHADVIVLGQNAKSPWRRFLSRLVGNEPDVTRYLQEHTDAELSVVS